MKFWIWIWQLFLFSFWNWELKIDFWIECEILIFVLELWVWKNNMDVSFCGIDLNHHGMIYERRFVIPFTEQRAGGLLRTLTYSVSRYWCNGIRGFPTEQRGCFSWVFVSCIIRRCPLFYWTSSSSVLYLFGTTQCTYTISVFYISSTPFEPVSYTHLTLPTKA